MTLFTDMKETVVYKKYGIFLSTYVIIMYMKLILSYGISYIHTVMASFTEKHSRKTRLYDS